MIFGIPRIPLVLGVLGLIPFVLWVGFDQGLVPDQLGPLALSHATFATYAAVILGFMGAIHWAWAMADERYVPGYFVAIGMALGGWANVVIPTLPSLFITLFLLLFIFDRAAVRAGLGPDWYIKLRLGLTAGVVTCLLVLNFL